MQERKIVFSDHAIERMYERVHKYNKKYNKSVTVEKVKDIITNDAKTIKRALKGEVKRYINTEETRIKYVMDDSANEVRIVITVSGFHNNQIKHFVDSDIAGLKTKSFQIIKKNRNKEYKNRKKELQQREVEEENEFLRFY